MDKVLKNTVITVTIALFLATLFRSLLTSGIFVQLERFLPRTDDLFLILALVIVVIFIYQIMSGSYLRRSEISTDSLFLALFSGGLTSVYVIKPDSSPNIFQIVGEVCLTLVWGLLLMNTNKFMQKQSRGSRLGIPTVIGIFIVLLILGLNGYKQRLIDEYNYTHPYIKSFEPILVTAWNKVILKGTGFGEKVNNEYKVVYEDGKQLKVDSWTESEIVIELSEIEDPVTIKVVRPSMYQGKMAERASNSITLDYFQVGQATPAQQKQYFDQLNNMSDEAKHIYGIN